jgi:2-polyprenyl-3-methyl-5-hydroxy-6-metoxy-1,4-benzoquinol methylase
MNSGQRDFDKAAASWDAQPWRERMIDGIVRAIREELRPTRSMDAMDFGCGTGLLTLALQPDVRSITGVDSARKMLDSLAGKIRERQLANVGTELVDTEGGDLGVQRYQLIVSSMVLHHVRDTAALFRQFFAALKPAGGLGIADLDLDDGEFHADPTGVFHHGFERDSLRRQLAEAGFVAIRDRTAAEIVRPGRSGGMRKFPVFLITATRPA